MSDKKKRIFTGKDKRKIAKEIVDKCKDNIDDNLLTFDFILEINLRKRLVKKYREAIFVENLIKILHINYSDSHPLNEIIIIHYASIAESVLGSIFKKNNSLKKIKAHDKIGKLFELGIITAKTEKSVRDLWDVRNHIHLIKSIEIKREFYKKHVANKQNTILELCNSIEAFFIADEAKKQIEL